VLGFEYDASMAAVISNADAMTAQRVNLLHAKAACGQPDRQMLQLRSEHRHNNWPVEL
jgi:hypothetical protein